jgi:hypothetical protein
MVMYKDLTKTTYGLWPNSTLFLPGGPRAAAVRQGEAGDCYFLAALASLAHQEPGFVRSMVRDQRGCNGSMVQEEHAEPMYSVRFFHRENRGGGYREIWVDVSGELPLDSSSRPLYAQPYPSPRPPQQAIWAPLVEKAFARFNDNYKVLESYRSGYEAIGSGGLMETALNALTGRPLHRLFLPVKSVELIWATVNLANSGAIMTASTWAAGKGLPLGHAYSVLGTEVRDGQNLVKLRNPYACCTPNNLEGGNGVFTLSMELFREYFDLLTYVPGDARYRVGKRFSAFFGK